MYLEAVHTSPLFGITDVVIGPFSSERERDDFKKHRLKILGCPGSLIVDHIKPPKNKTVMPVEYAQIILKFCEKHK